MPNPFEGKSDYNSAFEICIKIQSFFTVWHQPEKLIGTMSVNNETIHKKTSRLSGLRIYLLIALICAAAFSIQLVGQAQAYGVLGLSRRFTAGIFLAGFMTALIGLALLLSWSGRGRLFFQRLSTFETRSRTAIILVRLITIGYFVLCFLLFYWLVVGPFGIYVPDLAHRLPIFALMAIPGGLLLSFAFPVIPSLGHTLAFSSILLMVGFRFALFIPDVTTYPFSLGWSESSRYYYASLFFSEKIYGISLPPPVLHPSRYVLQAIPFIISSLPLWFHRFWQVFLWISLPFVTIFLLARRLKISPSWRYWFFILWAVLFLYQGPVYYHLTLCLIIVLWGYNPRSFARTLIFVIVASLWAGISRVNWIPVPGVLAATLYILDNRVGDKHLWKYLIQPAGWFAIGIISGLGSQFLYAIWSGNELEHFSTSFTSDLLWYRLIRFPTYQQGILFGVLVVSIPLFILTLERLKKIKWNIHPIRLLGLFLVLAVFFAGGLVVSVKIGGGNNLHNLDAFFFFLLLIAASLYFNQVQTEQDIVSVLPAPHPVLIAIVAFMPILYLLQAGGPIKPVDPLEVKNGLQAIDEFVEEAKTEEGDILFMAERHLLTFDMIKDVPLVADYERTYLMEMAMADTQSYLDQFYQDLIAHRYSLIITQPLNRNPDKEGELFNEENEAWVTKISRPLFCYYRPVFTVNTVSLQFMIPRYNYENLPGWCVYYPAPPKP